MTTSKQTSRVGGPCERKQNQFGDYEDVSNMTPADWDYRWSKQQTKFHMPQVHPMLKKHVDKLRTNNKKSRIFVSLCGKSLDMKWLSDQGFEVVGNEFADEGCKQFFEENNIPYTVSQLEGIKGVLYKSTSKDNICIYRCDVFDLKSSLIGRFDSIWDRGGFVALAVTERKKYASLLQSLMSPKCRYLLDCFLVDNNKFGGPPFNCDQEDVKQCFSTNCKIEKIDEKDVFGKWQESWGIDSFIEEVYLLESLT